MTRRWRDNRPDINEGSTLAAVGAELHRLQDGSAKSLTVSYVEGRWRARLVFDAPDYDPDALHDVTAYAPTISAAIARVIAECRVPR